MSALHTLSAPAAEPPVTALPPGRMMRQEGFDDLGFQGALLRRASGHALAFCWLTDDIRRRLPEPPRRTGMAERLAGLCQIALAETEALVIADLSADLRSMDHPTVTGLPHLRAFVALPLRSAQGEVLGLLCAADPRPRRISAAQLETMQRLADEMAARIALRLTDHACVEQPEAETRPEAIVVEEAKTTTSGGAPPARHGLSAMLMQWRDTFSAKTPQRDEYLPRTVATLTESRHNLGKIEANRRNGRETAGSRRPDDKGATRPEGERAVGSRLPGASLRALLVMALVALPSAILPGVTHDAQQMAALVALFAGAMTFVEYNAVYPGLIEFRHAPPFNRTRFALLAVTVVLLCLIERGRVEPTALTQFLDAVGALVGYALDFPYSPVRLATLMLTEGATAEQVAAVRVSAGLAMMVALIAVIWFIAVLRGGGWPSRRAAFNLWINLPTFDPTMGADIINRLDRDARINVALGFLLPFILPAVVHIASSGLDPAMLTAPQTLVWTMAIWAFLPTSLLMRGIALARVAQMIREKRQAAALSDGEGLLAA